MCSSSVAAGEMPIEKPFSFLQPTAAQYGTPMVAPVTKTPFCLTISRPNSSVFSFASGVQLPVSAAPDTQILYFMRLLLLITLVIASHPASCGRRGNHFRLLCRKASRNDTFNWALYFNRFIQSRDNWLDTFLSFD